MRVPISRGIGIRNGLLGRLGLLRVLAGLPGGEELLVVAGPVSGVFQNLVGLIDFAEGLRISGLLVVWVIARAQYTMRRPNDVRRGVGSDLENLIEGFHWAAPINATIPTSASNR